MKNKYSILAVLCLSGATVPFSGNSINLALKDISTDLGMNAVAISWIVTAMMLPSAVLQIPFGKAGDIIGHKKILLIGIALFTAASTACVFVTDGTTLLVLRFVQGVGTAMMFGTTMAIIMNVFPREERGKVIGINTAVVYLALAAGPVVGGMLTHYFGWRSIFAITALMGVISIAGIVLLLKSEWKEKQTGKFDMLGMGVYSGALVSILWGVSMLPSFEGIVLTVIGLPALLLFVFIEKRHSAPMFDVRMFFSNRVFRMSSFAALINYSATYAIGFLVSLYLQYIKGLDPQQAGWILLSQPVAMMSLSLLAGRLSDSIDATKLATLGMAVIVVSLCILLTISASTPVWLLITVLLVLGCGFGLFSSPNTNVIMSSVEKRHLGMASATTGTMRQVGQAFSMGITMMMLSLFVGKMQITVEVYPLLMRCMRVTFLILTVLCCAGVYLSSVRKRP
ncbi:MAG: MFS transporter [Tannerella sp.]|jgi:EmrB/QacA subfamily drug resistance transporter|nr:MFS transporter [Tannerella sp.]